MNGAGYDVVIPTIGRPSLRRLLDSLAGQAVPPVAIHVVADDGRGPAAARNRGWRASTEPWVVFLDDDVVVPPEWSRSLVRDLAVPRGIGAVQGRIRVPDRPSRPTDDERATLALEDATWVSADLAVRMDALRAIDGFDERLPHAYREDTDLALRLVGAGWGIARGTRTTWHPLRRDPWWSSVARQRGNADDAFMRRRHGPDWRRHARAPRGALPMHIATTACLAAAGIGALTRSRAVSIAGAGGWLALTMAFAAKRARGGPATPRELAAMAATSAVIPPVAVAQRLAGELRHRHVAAA